jgi:hypothetical protein
MAAIVVIRETREIESPLAERGPISLFLPYPSQSTSIIAIA